MGEFDCDWSMLIIKCYCMQLHWSSSCVMIYPNIDLGFEACTCYIGRSAWFTEFDQCFECIVPFATGKYCDESYAEVQLRLNNWFFSIGDQVPSRWDSRRAQSHIGRGQYTETRERKTWQWWISRAIWTTDDMGRSEESKHWVWMAILPGDRCNYYY